MKNVLITGANKSIGFEVARQLAKQGYYIYLGARDLQKGKDAAATLHREGLTNVAAIQIDISDPSSVTAARQELGGKIDVLDVLINNAGISGGFPQPATAVKMATMREVFDTNYFGTISVIGAFLDLVQKSASPRIVNVTSGLASLTLHNNPNWRFYQAKGGAYGPSKTALNAYTIALAYDLRDTPIKINAVDPGFTATDFNHHRGTNDIPTAASYIVEYATIADDGPTGQYISYDNNPKTGISPW